MKNKKKFHADAVAKYSGAHMPFLNISNVPKDIAKYDMTNTEFTDKFTTMLETVSYQRFSDVTKRRVSAEVSNVANAIAGIVKAVKENIPEITH